MSSKLNEAITCILFCLEDVTDQNSLNCVVVGVDSEGNDLYTGYLKNSGIACPPDCSANNPLNS